MVLRHLLLITPLVLSLAACETAQENPNYKYSSTYGQQSPQVLAQNSRTYGHLQAAPVRYTSGVQDTSAPRVYQAASPSGSAASYTRVNHECLNKERRRSVIGAGLGGTVGAIAGKEVIGGTKGTLIGAAAGGIAGYGIGDKTIRCDPVAVQAPVQQAVITPAYAPGTVIRSERSTPTYVQPIEQAAYVASPTEQVYSSGTVGTPGYEALRQSGSISASVPQYAQSQPNVISAPQQPVYTQPTGPIIQATTPQQSPLWPQSQTGLNGSYVVKSGDTVYSLSRQQCTSVSAVQALNNIDQDFNIKVGQALRLPPSECL